LINIISAVILIRLRLINLGGASMLIGLARLPNSRCNWIVQRIIRALYWQSKLSTVGKFCYLRPMPKLAIGCHGKAYLGRFRKLQL
jgi:hypothetical protein